MPIPLVLHYALIPERWPLELLYFYSAPSILWRTMDLISRNLNDLLYLHIIQMQGISLIADPQ